MKYLLSTLQIATLLFLVFSAKGQDIDFNSNSLYLHTIEAPSGLSIREKPSLDSKRIIVIPNGEKIQVSSFYLGINDNIENISGKWVHVKYKEIKGFVFDGFISKKPTYRIMGHYEVVPIDNSEQNLIGIFPETKEVKRWDRKYYIEKINFEKKENEVMGHKREWQEPDFIRGIHPVFTISGLPETSRETVGNYFNFSEGTLYPGTLINLRRGKKNYWIHAVGEVNKTGEEHNILSIKNYKVYLSIVENGNEKNQILYENTEINIDTEGSKGLCSLRFFGDIDNDNQPDIIIDTHQYMGWEHLLFLSREADEKELLKLVFKEEFSCC